ncbi:MAG: 30S ribosomal protein S16 [Candidatus Paceibacterota bacterium]
MLAIKLRPIGKKKQISYRIVIGEKRSKLDGKSLEDIGWYNPHTNKFSVNAERVQYWMKSGAMPTDSVHNILVTAKLIEGTKIALHKKKKEVKKS